MTTVIVPKSRWLDFKRAIFIVGFPTPLSAVHDDEVMTVTVTWEPDLTVEQSNNVNAWISALKSGITASEYLSIKPEIEGLRDYHNLATPTGAQTVLAVKAIIKVLRAIIKD